MSKFRPDWKDINVGFTILERGDYEFVVGEPKLINRTRERDGEAVYGFGVNVRDGNGKSSYINNYFHSEGSLPMVLEFVAACFGFNPTKADELNEFKAQHGENLFVDPEAEVMGETILNLAGKRVNCAVDQRPRKDTGEMQNTFRWRPFGG